MLTRLLLSALLAVSLFAPATIAPPTVSAADCQFVLGFKLIHDMIPAIVGDCTVDEHHNPTNGDGLQESTGPTGKGGLLVWRKADNWTAYTDGYWTWVNGPNGLQKRLNTERFRWEAGYIVAAVRNAEYRIPTVDHPFKLTDGEFTIPEERVQVKLDDRRTVSGDLNGDGVLDAVVLLEWNGGGSGTYEYAVEMIDHNGIPVQAGYEALGDRTIVNSFSIANGQVTVDMITRGDGDSFGSPTQRVVKTLWWFR